MKSVALSIGLIVVVASGGCGRGYPLAPVDGSVTYEGQPLKSGTIQFFPLEGRSATGRIEDGRILEVSTFDRGDGATIGLNRVAIYAFVREPVGMEIVPWAIPQRYGDPATSDLTADVQSGRRNHLTLQLTK